MNTPAYRVRHIDGVASCPATREQLLARVIATPLDERELLPCGGYRVGQWVFTKVSP